ncbi:MULTISPECIES: branched-chain amino acid ABC transporter permease [unclassified Dietzia]|uniref:branched-chain amino acid ABC transporter permease n=1 Tax=unclassified Dietzia TaxID=2617939 RepID=UPI0015FD4826|nr:MULTISPECIES: branched-chain amino acid ABC transporter permease [unclassified Dietzia]MBB1023013.1 branched-chain amino acid ABC transporter permease [Dietzia sp. DQ12-76]MBB1026828.1 branched-chain amino acid ABC transporter permease [Dietzia sp. DQ11-38-2]
MSTLVSAAEPSGGSPTPRTATGRRAGFFGGPRGRPELYSSYRQEQALFNTRAKALGAAVLVVLAVLLPLNVSDDVLRILGLGLVLAIGGIGLNLITGYAGQISLGHAFFVGVGAYTASVVAGDPEGRALGLGITFIPAWILAAGAMAALCGVIVAPLATRLRGLYLAVVTLGLVFLGTYIFTERGSVTGGQGVGREAPRPILFGDDLTLDSAFTSDQKLYWFFLALLLIGALAARNIARSRVGRAFGAIRDRDIAAGVMGVDLARYKLIAFTVSSFYAGVCGSLLFVANRHFGPEQFGLIMSIQFVAIVFIGGAATISGTIMGALLIASLPRISSEMAHFVPYISTAPNVSPNIYEVEAILYGGLIVAFLLFEPRGLFGIWLRMRMYWKSFPFTY